MSLYNKETPFKYQLTRWLKKEDLFTVTQQLNKYNAPHRLVCNVSGYWAVFTEGLFIQDRSNEFKKIFA